MNRLTSTARLVHRGPHRWYTFRRGIHEPTSSAGGLLRSQVPHSLRRGQRRAWPFGAYSLHNVPAVRAISFARVLPNLALKLVRIPAIFGGAMIAGLAYLQYQATRRDFDRAKSLQELLTDFNRGWHLCGGYVSKDQRNS